MPRGAFQKIRKDHEPNKVVQWCSVFTQQRWTDPKKKYWYSDLGLHAVYYAAGRYYVKIGGRRYTVVARRHQRQHWQPEGAKGSLVAVLADRYDERHFGLRHADVAGGYDAIKSACETIDPHRNSQWRPLTRARSTSKQFRVRGDGVIEFAYYNTVMLRYHPDGAVWVGPWTCVGDARFISSYAPEGLDPYRTYGDTLLFTAKRGPDVKRYGLSTWFAERTEIVTCSRDGIIMRRTPEGWQVDNPEVVPKLDKVSVDRKRGRELGKQYHFADMITYIKTITQLMQDGDGFMREQIDDYDRSWDMDRALEHMEKREFDVALRYLPPVQDTYWGYAPYWNRDSLRLSPQSVKRCRQYLYEQLCVYNVERVTTMTPSEYERARSIDI